MQSCVPLPRVYAVELGRQQAQKETESFRPGRSPLERSRHLREEVVVVLAAVGLSGVIARVSAFLRGTSQSGTHVGDRKPSVQR